jgi:hypothetical protein
MSWTSSYVTRKVGVLSAIFTCFFSGWWLPYSSLSVFGQQDLKIQETAERDIIFVVDNAGSMKKNDPHFITREVVANFSKSLTEKSRLGLVVFDNDARMGEQERRG